MKRASAQFKCLAERKEPVWNLVSLSKLCADDYYAYCGVQCASTLTTVELWTPFVRGKQREIFYTTIETIVTNILSLVSLSPSSESDLSL
jgi:hypothetical protein